MSDHTIPVSLSPLDRLQLRDALQDRWRAEVERITGLSMELYTALDDRGDSDTAVLDPAAVSQALSDARLRLLEIEQAMHRLDDRTYGRCGGCLMPMAFEEMVDQPEARYCAACRTASAARPAEAMAQAG